MNLRVIMRAVLDGAPAPGVVGMRRFSPDDVAPLGPLLFAAYLGTIDQKEETIEQAQAEIDKTISGDYGVFLPDCSFVVERSGRLSCAALLTRFRNRPFIAYVVTHPDSLNQGLARACIRAAMLALHAKGEREVHLVVTRANLPAFHLYGALGFDVERDV